MRCNKNVKNLQYAQQGGKSKIFVFFPNKCNQLQPKQRDNSPAYIPKMIKKYFYSLRISSQFGKGVKNR